MADNMIEIDIEEILFGSMGGEKPVIREPYSDGNQMLLLDEPEILSFTGEGIADRLVYRVGSWVEFRIDDSLLPPGMNDTKPVLREPVNAGGSKEIPIGAKLGLPGDTLRILDFEENAKTHIINIVNGEIKSWAVHEDGSLPTVANTHEVTIQNGLIKTWNISSGGSRPTPSNTHIIDILKGLVQNWLIS